VTRALFLVALLISSPAAVAISQSATSTADTTPPAALADSDSVNGAASNMSDSGAAGRPDSSWGDCYRFVFGEWTPPLDAKAAGHAPFPPAESLPKAPGGRGWALSDSTAHDMQLMLYPSFWPAGVSVRFPHAPRTRSDTVRGMAMALVADGRVRSPEAEAMAWLVPCSR
jgi:hypothetical protein